ncbi:MAG: DUF1214 domain-containing protein [Sphingobium sp.]
MTEPSAIEDICQSLMTMAGFGEEAPHLTPALRREYHNRILMYLSHGYMMVHGSRLDCPCFVPFVGPVFFWGSPNPDTQILHASIDPTGSYRISGTRGTTEIATLMLQASGPAEGAMPGRVLGEVDLDEIELDDEGRFTVLLSGERPADWQGDWLRLDGEVGTLVTRSIAAVPEQTDARFAIERIDRPVANHAFDSEAWTVANRNLLTFCRYISAYLLKLVEGKIQALGTNSDLVYRVMPHGNQTRQFYCEGLFSLEEGECLVLEVQIPDRVRYWSVQLFDMLYGSIDFVFHQSSLNGSQAVVDPDGWVRIVVSATDPGVANWLDTAGARQGGIMWRWNEVDHQPAAGVRLTSIANLRQELPPETRLVSPQERAEVLGARARAYQLRRRW